MKYENLNNIKKTGFKTPDNYFESIDETILEKIASQKKIQNIDDPGFKVPYNYFDNVDKTILSQLNSDEKTKVIALFNKKNLYYIAGLAASLLIFVAIFFNNTTNEELSVDVVESYLENRNLTSYELAQLLSEAEILDEDFTITETDFEEENLEAYLLENTDIESILN